MVQADQHGAGNSIGDSHASRTCVCRKKGKSRNGKTGWVDDHGNVWVPAPSGTPAAHGGGHWDVQSPNGNGYTNVYPGGGMSPGRGIPPVLPTWVQRI